MIELRDYQRAAIDAHYSWFEKSSGNPLIVVPTGGGKSVIISEFVREVVQDWPDQRIAIVTHVKELVEQNHAALKRSWPDAPTGIYSAGLKRRDTRSQILFGSVQSMYRRATQFGHVDLLLVDESHLIPPRGFGMYQQLIAGLRGVNPSVKMIGYTATPFRTDTGRLDTGQDRLFDGVAYEVGVGMLIEQGYLSPLVNKGTANVVDTTDVHKRGGEFIAGELEAAAMAGDLVERTVEELVRRSENRRAWLIFCCGVEHAEAVEDALSRRGIVTTSVFGDTPRDVRDSRIEAFRNGDVTAMVNVNVLTTGFDVPHVDLVALLRPTQSPGLYVQMVGRGFRIAPGKADCLVLDFGGNVQRHGPVDAVEVSEKSPGNRDIDEDKLKKCPECYELVDIIEERCPSCGHVFEVVKRKPDHDDRPDEDTPILGGERASPIQRWTVERVIREKWVNPEKPHPTLRVTYLCGWRKKVSEWICFEHSGYPRRKAESWWFDNGGLEMVPETVDEALNRIKRGELHEPIHVTVDVRGEWPELRGVKLDDSESGMGDFAEAGDHLPFGEGEDEIPF